MSDAIDTVWYAQMAAAMKTREKCLNAIARWEDSLAEAEAAIDLLRSGQAAVAPSAEPQAPATPVSAPVVEFSPGSSISTNNN